MTNKELYQQTFSQVHSSTDIRWEDMEQLKRKKRISKGLVTLAAVICLLAAASTVAVAADWFGLRELLLPRQQVTMPMDPETGEREVKTVDMIGLSGYLDTAESHALAEWQEFLNGYEVEAAASEADHTPGQVDERYSLYQVYNQEMADKLDEIVEKYGLRLHSVLADILPEEWNTAVGPFALEGNTACSGYIYEDGTFAYDGEAELPGYGVVDYQFRRSVKGCFNEVILNIDDVSQYQEWVYETACGVPVTLALGPFKGLLITDLGDSFVTVNVLAGTETDPDDIFSSGPVSAADLEALADSFDFTALTPVRDPGLAVMEEPAAPDTPEKDTIYAAAGIQESVAQAFYAEFVRAIEKGRKEDAAGRIAWPRTVHTQEGNVLVETAEDFLPYYDDIFTEGLLEAVHRNQYTADRADLFANDGMVGAAGGAIWFALLEDGEIAVLTVQNPEGNRLRYGGPAGIQRDTRGEDLSGVYTDTQGTDDVYSELELRLQTDGTYTAVLGLYRLTTLEGTAAYDAYGALWFTCDDPAVKGVVTVDGETAEVTVMESEFSYLQPGDAFRFPDGRK